LELLAYKAPLVLRVDRVQEVLRVYLEFQAERDQGETLDCLATLVYKAPLDHLDSHLCLSQTKVPVIHKQVTMTKDQQLHALQVNLVPEALQALKEDQALLDHLDRTALRESLETEAHRVLLALLAHLVPGEGMEIQVLQVQLDTLAHVAHQERRELRDW
jgi:hypothetical protein